MGCTMASNIVKFEIELNAQGFGKIIIDGVDMSNKVSGVTIRTKAGRVTTVSVEYGIAEVRVNGEGLEFVQ